MPRKPIRDEKGWALWALLILGTLGAFGPTALLSDVTSDCQLPPRPIVEPDPHWAPPPRPRIVFPAEQADDRWGEPLGADEEWR